MSSHMGIHEAGHAVAAVALGIGLRTRNKVGLSIIPKQNGNVLGFCRYRRSAGQDHINRMAVALAGGVAQVVLNSTPFEHGTGDDIHDVIVCLHEYVVRRGVPDSERTPCEELLTNAMRFPLFRASTERGFVIVAEGVQLLFRVESSLKAILQPEHIRLERIRLERAFKEFQETFLDAARPFVCREWYEPLLLGARRSCQTVMLHQDTILSLARRLDEVKTMSGQEADAFIRSRIEASKTS